MQAQARRYGLPYPGRCSSRTIRTDERQAAFDSSFNAHPERLALGRAEAKETPQAFGLILVPRNVADLRDGGDQKDLAQVGPASA